MLFSTMKYMSRSVMRSSLAFVYFKADAHASERKVIKLTGRDNAVCKSNFCNFQRRRPTEECQREGIDHGSLASFLCHCEPKFYEPDHNSLVGKARLLAYYKMPRSAGVRYTTSFSVVPFPESELAG